MGTKYTENNIMRHSAKELFFKAALLYLTLEDDIGLKKFIDTSTDKDPFFNNSMEQKFLNRILDAWISNDHEAFGHEW